MFDIEKELKEKGLTVEIYENILKDCSKKITRTSDLEWQDIVDKYNLGIHYDSLRKNNSGIFGAVFVKDYLEWKHEKENNEDAYLLKLEEKKREIERLKVQYRDERSAWSKQNYSAARIDSTLSLLENELKSIGNANFEIRPIKNIDGEKEMIVMLSDLHIGQTFSSSFGEYNSDIAKRRLNQYLNKIIHVAKLHTVKSVSVVNLADVISGSIHKNIAISNRENVINQIKTAAEYIASFCYDLSCEFEIVKYYAVTGNHERLEKKEDALHDERYGDLVNWGVEMTLSHIENFHYFNHRNIDTGIVDINICGKTYIGCHGDFDPMSKQGVANLSFLLGFIPHAILRGHLHYPAMNEINGVKVVQCGSLAGSGDDYTIEKRLTGKPSQTLCVCDKNGIDCIYNVELN